MEDTINNLKALARNKSNQELQPLFVFSVLTGKLLYESNDNPHKKDWEELSDAGRKMFEDAATKLRMQLCLCSKCGERAPLFWDGVCIECDTAEPDKPVEEAHDAS